MKKKIAVIGGGLVGLATAYKLSVKYEDKVKIFLVEKEAGICRHQSGNNSGVLHAGLYYKPGSLKAQMATSGIRQMMDFCRQHNIPHEQCGKLVVATTPQECEGLKTLLERGQLNGLEGLKLMDGEAIKEYEPYCRGMQAIHVPQEGIVDYKRVGETLRSLLIQNGAEVVNLFNFSKVVQRPEGLTLHADSGQELMADYIVNCAGLYSDVVAKQCGIASSIQIIPFRGEYYTLKDDAKYLVKNLIYPVPDIQYPFLGVHFTRMIDGAIEAGPNAVLAFRREGYKLSQVNIGELASTLAFPGLMKFLLKHKSMAYHEIMSSLFTSVFVDRLKKLVPDIQKEHIEKGGAGVRAQAMDTNGQLVQDFAIDQNKFSIHLINAPSPGATASLAIADYLISKMEVNTALAV